jgi:hypothetical protein
MEQCLCGREARLVFEGVEDRGSLARHAQAASAKGIV